MLQDSIKEGWGVYRHFPGDANGKESASNAGDARDGGSVSGLGRSPGGENGNPLQYSCLENCMNRGAWRTTVHGVAKSQTRLSNWAFMRIVGALRILRSRQIRKMQSYHKKPIPSYDLDIFHSQGGEFTNIDFYLGSKTQGTTAAQEENEKMAPKLPLKSSERGERSTRRLLSYFQSMSIALGRNIWLFFFFKHLLWRFSCFGILSVLKIKIFPSAYLCKKLPYWYFSHKGRVPGWEVTHKQPVLAYALLFAFLFQVLENEL